MKNEFLFIVLIIIPTIFLNYFYQNFVRKNSVCQKILLLNQSINFHEVIDSVIKINFICNSKHQFDYLLVDKKIIEAIEQNTNSIETKIYQILDNRKKYTEYQSECKMIFENLQIGNNNTIKDKILCKIEKIICRSLLLNPKTEIKIHFMATYVSPKGRNNYHNPKTYSCDETIKIYNDVILKRQREQSRKWLIQRERNKVTPSLRFRILKRDNFTCRSCGSTASEGAKLHVDHKIPVAKGGKTELSNLQTLCDYCNLGKGDKLY